MEVIRITPMSIFLFYIQSDDSFIVEHLSMSVKFGGYNNMYIKIQGKSFSNNLIFYYLFIF